MFSCLNVTIVFVDGIYLMVYSEFLPLVGAFWKIITETCVDTVILLYHNFFNFDQNLSVKSMYFCTWAFLMLFKQSEPYLTVLQHCVKFSQHQELLCLKHTIMENQTFS